MINVISHYFNAKYTIVILISVFKSLQFKYEIKYEMHTYYYRIYEIRMVIYIRLYIYAFYPQSSSQMNRNFFLLLFHSLILLSL